MAIPTVCLHAQVLHLHDPSEVKEKANKGDGTQNQNWSCFMHYQHIRWTYYNVHVIVQFPRQIFSSHIMSKICCRFWDLFGLGNPYPCRKFKYTCTFLKFAVAVNCMLFSFSSIRKRLLFLKNTFYVWFKYDCVWISESRILKTLGIIPINELENLEFIE